VQHRQLRRRRLLQHGLRGRLRLVRERHLHGGRGRHRGEPGLRPLPLQRELGRLPHELQQQRRLLLRQQLSGGEVRLSALLPDDLHLVQQPERLRGHLLPKLQRLLHERHMRPSTDVLLLNEADA
jgi:hypothetical protein